MELSTEGCNFYFLYYKTKCRYIELYLHTLTQMMNSNCRPCHSSRQYGNNSSWLSALLIVIIPKCPFCIMAYTSAISMCGTGSLYFSENNWVSFIPLVLALIIILMIGLNYRDRRTVVALMISAVGFGLILGSHQLVLESHFYNWGTGLLFFSIFLNGSLFSFVSNLRKIIYSRYQLIANHI